MNQTTKTVISNEVAEQITSAFKVMHHAVLNHLVANKGDTTDIPSDFTKCTLDTYKKVGLLARGMLSDKVEADRTARLLPYQAAITKATETYMSAAQAAWAQVLALPAETRETLGLKAPVSVKVPVSAFAATWKTPTDMSRDLNEMKIGVVKSEKGDYINVPFALPAPKSVETAKAA